MRALEAIQPLLILFALGALPTACSKDPQTFAPIITDGSASAGGAASSVSVSASAGNGSGAAVTSTASASSGSGGAASSAVSSSSTGSGGIGGTGGMGGAGGSSSSVTASASSSSTSGTGGGVGGVGGPAVTYQIDIAHTGAQTGSLPLPLTQHWSVKLGGNISYPLIVDGLVYVTVANTGNTYGTKLYALDQGTGAVAWGPINLTGTYYWSNAAYDTGKIFVIDYDGLLRAFDAGTGNALWSKPMPGQYAFSSPPTAAQGIVYVGGAGSGGTVYAVAEANGDVLWTASVENGDNSSPAVSATGVYVSYSCNQVYDFAPALGGQIWHSSGGCEGGGGRTPALFGGKLYVRDLFTANVVLDASTGTGAGPFDAGPIPAFAGSSGFFSNQGTLTARAVATLAPEWTFNGDGMLSSAPVVADGHVFIGASSGNLYALDVQTGNVDWSTNVGAPIWEPDEQNVSTPLTGLAIGGGALIVPAGNVIAAYW